MYFNTHEGAMIDLKQQICMSISMPFSAMQSMTLHHFHRTHTCATAQKSIQLFAKNYNFHEKIQRSTVTMAIMNRNSLNIRSSLLIYSHLSCTMTIEKCEFYYLTGRFNRLKLHVQHWPLYSTTKTIVSIFGVALIITCISLDIHQQI